MVKRLWSLLGLFALLWLALGAVSAETTHIVQRGETLYRISLQYGVSVQAIADANNLVNPNTIFVGQLLRIPDAAAPPPPATSAPVTPAPVSQTYVVQAGDTLYRIALRFGIAAETLAAANGITNPNLIYVGQRLQIPAGSPPAPPPPAPTAPPVPAPTTAPPVGDQIYIVQRGDTLRSIAQRYGVTVQAIVNANGINNPNLIYVGQQLLIPAAGAAPPTALPPAPQPTNPPTPSATPTAPAPTPPAPTASATQVPPTATAVPPTATPLPTAVPVGPNLLVNSSFEDGWYNLNGIPELQVPNGWRLEWDTGPNPFGSEWIRPETRVLSGAFLPPHEQPLFIYDGWYTFKAFKGYGPISLRLLSDIQLAPGTYELRVQVFPDQVVRWDNGTKIFAADPSAAQVRLIGGGSDSGWLFPRIGQRNVLSWRFDIEQTQTTTVGVAMRGRYGLINNGFFTDAWSLQRVGP